MSAEEKGAEEKASFLISEHDSLDFPSGESGSLTYKTSTRFLDLYTLFDLLPLKSIMLYTPPPLLSSPPWMSYM